MPRTTHTIQQVSRPGRGAYYQAKINGKQVYLGRTRGDAKKKLRSLLAGQPGPQVDQPSTIAGLASRWIEAHQDEVDQLAKFLAFVDAGLQLDEVEPDLLERYHDYLKAATYHRKGKGGKPGKPRKYATHTIRNYITTAASLFKFGQARGWIAAPPRTPKTDRPLRQPKDLPPEHVAASFAGMREPSRSAAMFIYWTGCRPGEACKLRWEWFRPSMGECGAFILPAESHKTGRSSGKSRTVYLTPSAKAIVDRLPRSAETVFVNQLGRPFTPGGLRSVGRRHGISRPYSLRHSYAQGVLEQGVSMETLGKLLGHSDMATTSIYAQVRDAQALAAAAAIQDPMTVKKKKKLHKTAG